MFIGPNLCPLLQQAAFELLEPAKAGAVAGVEQVDVAIIQLLREEEFVNQPI